MKLRKATVSKYRSIDDSSPVEIDEHVTCLVGKNESGKTNFLRALYLLNPVEQEGFNADVDYPRKDWAQYKSEHAKKPATVVTADFSLEDEEVAAFKEEFGPAALRSTTFTATKNYANVFNVNLDVDETAAIRHFIETKVTAEPTHQQALKHVSNLKATIASLSADEDPAMKALAPLLAQRFPKSVSQTAIEWLWKKAPRFVYFSDYQFMPGTASIPNLIERKQQGTLTVGEMTLLRLIAKAGLTLDELKDEKNFERYIANLEAAAIAITREVFAYWTQNKNLKVRFMTSGPVEGDAKLNRGPLVRVRIENTRHDVSVTFDERSRGFVWFFSFLAYFSELERTTDTDLILLLDEPGLSLHATAQADLLRFVDARLGPKHQVLYTTHSPFMVNAKRLDRVRTVQDMEDTGTVVSRDVMRNDEATLFPLQAALGFEITQTLFIGPNSLLVEGPSEVLYIPEVSEQLAANKKTPLDPRWTLTPIGGIDKAPSFVSLFGAQKINIAVLMDYANQQKRLVEGLQKALVSPNNVIPLHNFRGGKETDIEDIFDEEDYLTFVNETYRRELRKPLKASDLTHASERIVKRLEHYFEAHNINGGKFSHAAVAMYYSRNGKDFKPFSQATLKRFEEVFKTVNGLLPPANR